jgi:hypothetical protein
MSVVETIFLCHDARDPRILGVQGKLLAEEKTSTMCCLARSYCPPADPAGVPPTGDLDTACQRMGRDALNAERARRPSA